MSPPDLATVATLLTATASLLIVLEMRWQRRSSHRPELVVENAQVSVFKQGLGDHHWGCLKHGSEGTSGGTNKDSIECRNIGTGQAKQVEFEWTFDYHAFIAKIGELDSRSASQIWIEDDFLTVNSEGSLGSSHNLPRQLRGSLPTVGLTESGTVSVPFPSVYLALLSAWAFALSKTNSPPREELASFSLTLRYRDMTNVSYTKRFNAQPHIISIRFGDSENENSEPVEVLNGLIEMSED